MCYQAEMCAEKDVIQRNMALHLQENDIISQKLLLEVGYVPLRYFNILGLCAGTSLLKAQNISVINMTNFNCTFQLQLHVL